MNPVRQRRGINLSFYVLKEGQDFLEARSLPLGTLGHRERSASGVLRRAFSAFQWLIQEHARVFQRWPQHDFVVLLRCLPAAPLFSGDRAADAAQVLTIPDLVAQEAKRMDLERVMDLGPRTIPALLKRLRNLSPIELVALYDHLERLRVEYLKQT